MKKKGKIISSMTARLRWRKLLVMCIDQALMLGSFVLAMILRYGGMPPNGRLWTGLLAFLPLLPLWAAALYVAGAYRFKNSHSKRVLLRQLLLTFAACGALAVSYFYLLPDRDFTPKSILLIFLLLYFIVLYAWRLVAPAIGGLSSRPLRMVLLGSDDLFGTLLKDRQALLAQGFSPLYWFEPDTALNANLGLKAITGTKSLQKLLNSRAVDLVVIGSSSKEQDHVRETLFNCLSPHLVHMSVEEFHEVATGRVPINAINQIWFLEHLRLNDKINFERAKRVFDFSGALFGLLLTLPLWPLIWIGIKLDSPGPGFFRQVRSCYLGKPFTILKFRTMSFANNNLAITVANDARITRLGMFLRKSRLDELPQLWNILCGHMSFVGPRPERPELIEKLAQEVPFYHQRMLVQPGLTGWDQVCGEYHSATVEDTLKKLQYDLYYVKNRTLYLDTSILLRTVGTVLSRAGR